jgi:hypothetical protein
MHTTTEHRSSKTGRRSQRPSGSRRCTQPERSAAPQKTAEAATRIEEHDPMLLLAAMEEIECRQKSIEVLLTTGLLGHCLQ